MRGLSATLPAGLRITRVYDLAGFVRDAIASVREAILIGGALAIVILLVFLRDWRLTLIAAITLPLAVVPTFAFLWLFGGTINLMSMGGIAVAIGLVIDDAVVVVERLHRVALSPFCAGVPSAVIDDTSSSSKTSMAPEGGASVADAVSRCWRRS